MLPVNPIEKAPLTNPSSAISNCAIITIIITQLVKQSIGGFACLRGPCLHGVCIDDLNSTHECYCRNGFTGYSCEINWDECRSSPCFNGGQCIDGIASFNCSCPQFYAGSLCELDLRSCDEDYKCLNNGTCLINSETQDFECSCIPGFAGDNCEIDVSICNSTKDICLHGGECLDGIGNAFFCQCNPAWTGQRCEVDVCETNPCENGGVCVQDIKNGFKCACPFGFTGNQCDIKLQLCDENPCQNGALCLAENGTRTCYCVPDYHGELCELKYNDCEPSPKCFNGGTCIDGVGQFNCSCPIGFFGLQCQCWMVNDTRICSDEQEVATDRVNSTTTSSPYDPGGTTELLTTEFFTEIIPKETLRPSSLTISSELESSGFLSDSVTVGFKASDSIIVSDQSNTEVLVPSSTKAQPPEISTEVMKSSDEPATVSEKSQAYDAYETLSVVIEASSVTKEEATMPSQENQMTGSSYSGTYSKTFIYSDLSSYSDDTSSGIVETQLQSTELFQSEVPSPGITSVEQTSDTERLETTLEMETRSHLSRFSPLESSSILFSEQLPTSHMIESTIEASEEYIDYTESSAIMSSMKTTSLSSDIQSTDKLTSLSLDSAQVIIQTTVATSEFYTENSGTVRPTEDASSDEISSIESDWVIPSSTVTLPFSPHSKSVTLENSDNPDLSISASATLITPSVDVSTTELLHSTQTPNTTDPCQDYCQNGAECVSKSIEIVCICNFKFIGKRCEHRRQPFESLAFQGGSFVRYNIPSQAINRIDLVFQMATIIADGIIMYTSAGRMYALIFLQNGLLSLHFSCGSQSMQFVETRTKVNNGYHFTLHFHMELVSHTDQEWRCLNVLSLNSSYTMQGEQVIGSNGFQGHPIDQVYFGGVDPTEPQDNNNALLSLLPGYKGCMYNLKINEELQDLFENAVEGYRLQQCNALGCVGEPCATGSKCIQKETYPFWKCLCPIGLSGKKCQRRVCDNNPCQNGATCASIMRPSYSKHNDTEYLEPITNVSKSLRDAKLNHSDLISEMVCLCPLRYTGHRCETKLNITKPFFNPVSGHDYSSYLMFKDIPNFPNWFQLKLHFYLKNVTQIALMLYSGGLNQEESYRLVKLGREKSQHHSTDFMAITILHGYIILTWNLGSGTQRIYSPSRIDPRLSIHTLYTGRNGRDAWLKVDGMRNVTGSSPGYKQQLNGDGIIFIGGHENFQFEGLPHDLPLHKGFQGCIFDVGFRIKNRIYLPKALKGRNVKNCFNDC